MPNPDFTIQIERLQHHNVHLLDELDRLYRGFAAEEGHTAPPEHFRDFIAARLDDLSMLVMIAQVEDSARNNRAVGYALIFDVMEHPFIPNWQRCGYVTQLFVDAGCRRQGVGQRMIEYGLEWLTQRGVPEVMLNVDVDNDEGERFWREVGFAPHLIRMKKNIDSAHRTRT